MLYIRASLFDLILTGLTHGHYTRVRANAIRPYIWRFQGEAWVSPDIVPWRKSC